MSTRIYFAARKAGLSPINAWRLRMFINNL